MLGNNWGMSYFTAAVAQTDDEYRPVDIDVEEWSDLDELAETIRSVAGEDCEAVAIVEREDEWFAIVRLTETDNIKVFISDIEAAQASPYADLFEDYLDSPLDEYELEDGDDFDDDYEEPSDDDEAESAMFPDEDSTWGGDSDIFDDLGVSASDLLDQCEKHSADPARIVAHVGEIVGFDEALEAAR